jgi:hypothetical protein
MIAAPGDGARDGRFFLRIDQANVPPAGSDQLGSARTVPRLCVAAALVLTGCNANQEANL